MLNSGLLLYLLLLINPGRYKVCSKTIEFLSSELASVSRRHPSLKCTNDLSFSAEEMLRRGLCIQDLRDSAWNVSETTTIPQCLPLCLGGAESS